MGRQYWIWVAVAVVLSSSVLTTAKFNVPHVLDAGEAPTSFVHLALFSVFAVTTGISFLPGSF